MENNTTHTQTSSNIAFSQEEMETKEVIIRGKENSLTTLSPFQRKSAVEKLGKVRRCEQRRNGSLLVEFERSDAARSALSTSHLTFWVREEGKKVEKDIPVEIQLCVVRSRTKGIISCRQLQGISDEDIADGLSDQGVTTARRLGKTDAITLEFSAPSLPNRVFVGYTSVPVRVYVPDPLRCFRCHRFGHGAGSCRGAARCGRCGQPEHGKECQGDAKCVHCKESHPAWSRQCRVYKTEREIAEIRVKQAVSFAEAKRIYHENHPTVSYRDALMSQTRQSTTTATVTDTAHSSLPVESSPGARVRSSSVGHVTLTTKVRDLLDMTIGDLLRMIITLLPPAREELSTSSHAGVPSPTPPTTATNTDSGKPMMHTRPPQNDVSASLDLETNATMEAETPVSQAVPEIMPYSSLQESAKPPEENTNKQPTVIEDNTTVSMRSEDASGTVRDTWTVVGKGGKPISHRTTAKKSPDEHTTPEKLPQTPIKCDRGQTVGARKPVVAPRADTGPPPLPPPPPRRQGPRTPQGPAARPRPPGSRFLSPPGSSPSHRPDKRTLSGTPSPNSMESPHRKQRLQPDSRDGHYRRNSIGASPSVSGASYYFDI